MEMFATKMFHEKNTLDTKITNRQPFTTTSAFNESKVVFRCKGCERDFMPQEVKARLPQKQKPRTTDTGMPSLKEKDTFKMKPDAMLC